MEKKGLLEHSSFVPTTRLCACMINVNARAADCFCFCFFTSFFSCFCPIVIVLCNSFFVRSVYLNICLPFRNDKCAWLRVSDWATNSTSNHGALYAAQECARALIQFAIRSWANAPKKNIVRNGTAVPARHCDTAHIFYFFFLGASSLAFDVALDMHHKYVYAGARRSD